VFELTQDEIVIFPEARSHQQIADWLGKLDMHVISSPVKYR